LATSAGIESSLRSDLKSLSTRHDILVKEHEVLGSSHELLKSTTADTKKQLSDTMGILKKSQDVTIALRKELEEYKSGHVTHSTHHHSSSHSSSGNSLGRQSSKSIENLKTISNTMNNNIPTPTTTPTTATASDIDSHHYDNNSKSQELISKNQDTSSVLKSKKSSGSVC